MMSHVVEDISLSGFAKPSLAPDVLAHFDFFFRLQEIKHNVHDGHENEVLDVLDQRLCAEAKELFDMQSNLKAENKIDSGAPCRTMLAKRGDGGEGQQMTIHHAL